MDYGDTFTQSAQGGSNPNRPSTAAIQPAAAYVIESTYGNPSVNFQSAGLGAGQGSFSFASDGPGLVNGAPAYPGGSGAGSATGITQTGGSVDYGIPYGLRDEYVVQVDAVASGDRIDITTAPEPGSIFQNNSLSVFFRGDGSGNASLFTQQDGVNRDTPIRSQPGYENFNTGLTGGGRWHNYAVRFDRPDNEIELFVDERSVGLIDLTSFAGGIYADFSNGAVGAGGGVGGGESRTWTDNFQVGAPVPEPGGLALCLLGFASLARRPRRGA